MPEASGLLLLILSRGLFLWLYQHRLDVISLRSARRAASLCDVLLQEFRESLDRLHLLEREVLRFREVGGEVIELHGGQAFLGGASRARSAPSAAPGAQAELQIS